MRKNWLARIEANTAARRARNATVAVGRWFRSRPVVPDSAFQGGAEPYPGHWRRFPEPWHGISRAQVLAALEELPDTWREVLLRRDGSARDRAGRETVDAAIADELGLTPAQERDILARARAALRDGVDRAQEAGPR